MRFFSAIKSALSLISGGSALKKQADFVKSDVSHFKSDFSAVSSAKVSKKADRWQLFVEAHELTTQNIKAQYRARRHIAGLLICALFVCLYIVTIDACYSIGFACLTVIVLLYVQNVFRLYQIRHRELCTIKHFLCAAKYHFYEFLPLALPSDWQVLDDVVRQQA